MSANGAIGAEFGPSDPKAVRRAHLREESYLKAVGKLNYLYAILFGVLAAYFLRLTLLHLFGRINADWSIHPGWVIFQANAWAMAILAVAAGYGFGRLRPWAMRVEALFVLSYLIAWPLSIVAHSRPPGLGEFIGGVLLLAAFLVPLINLWDLKGSPVMAPEYRRVVAATPGARVSPKLSWELKLVMLVLFVVATTILVFSVER